MQNLKIIRKNKKLTQLQIASVLGISRSTYTQYETGASQPDNQTLIKLANFLNVPISFLLEEPPFDSFQTLLEHPDVLNFSMEEICGDSFSAICPSITANLDIFINLFDALVAKASLRADGEDFTITLSPRIPLDTIQNALSDSISTRIAHPALAPDEQKLIDDYRTLNDQGKEHIRVCMASAQALFKESGSNISNLESKSS